MRHVALYARVSSKRQDTRSQLPDLERWAAAQDQPVKWYKDRFTGRTMDRPGWNQLEAEIQSGKVSAVVCWRLDRLGRTARGLTALFDDLLERRWGLSVCGTAWTWARRRQADGPYSGVVAEYETEIRAERIIAGQAAARAKGKVWGGGKPGRRIRLSIEKENAIRQLTVKASRLPRSPASSASAGPRSTRRSADTGVYLAGGLF